MAFDFEIKRVERIKSVRVIVHEDYKQERTWLLFASQKGIHKRGLKKSRKTSLQTMEKLIYEENKKEKGLLSD